MRARSWTARFLEAGGWTQCPANRHDTIRAVSVHLPVMLLAAAIILSATNYVVLSDYFNTILPAASVAVVLLLGVLTIACYRRSFGSTRCVTLIHLINSINALLLVSASILVADQQVDARVQGIILIAMNASMALVTTLAFGAMPTVGILMFLLVGIPGIAKIVYDGEPLTVTIGLMLAAIFVLVVRMINEANRLRLEGMHLRMTLAEISQKATASDIAKSELLAHMSQELRTPLETITTAADLLRETSLDTRQTTFADIISKTGGTLGEVIEATLELSRLKAGSVALEPKPFHLEDMIGSVADSSRPAFAGKDVELVIEVRPGLPAMVVCDGERLRQALTEIVGSRIHSTSQGHIAIEVTGEPNATLPEILRLDFRIEDTGAPISEAVRSAAFDRFWAGDGLSGSQVDDTGLGLPIAAAIIELMGGALTLERSSEAGTLLHFSLNAPVYVSPEPGGGCRTGLPRAQGHADQWQRDQPCRDGAGSFPCRHQMLDLR